MTWNSAELIPPAIVPPAPVEFSVLDAAVPADLAAWRVQWSGWPDREIMAHPDFVRRFARPGDRVLAAAEAEAFWSRFNRWARSHDVVTSFARLSLFPDQLLPFDGDVVVNSPNVVRRLDLGDEELWNDYAPKVRQNVRRARSRGCSLLVDAEGARL